MSDPSPFEEPNHPGGGPAVLPHPDEQVEEEHDEEQRHDTSGEGWRVVLHNDEEHSVDQVAVQIVLATSCPWENAVEITLKVHFRGHATVIISDQDEAKRVASILRQIALNVTVEKVG